MPEDIKRILKDYVATANNPKYNNDWNVINSKFPELNSYDKNILKDYVATANNPKYNNNWELVDSKFPEFFSGDIKKKSIVQQAPLQEQSSPTNSLVDGQSSLPTPTQTPTTNNVGFGATMPQLNQDIPPITLPTWATSAIDKRSPDEIQKAISESKLDNDTKELALKRAKELQTKKEKYQTIPSFDATKLDTSKLYDPSLTEEERQKKEFEASQGIKIPTAERVVEMAEQKDKDDELQAEKDKQISQDYFNSNINDFIETTAPIYGEDVVKNNPQALAYLSPVYWTKMGLDLKNNTDYSERQIAKIIQQHKEDLKPQAVSQLNKLYVAQIMKQNGVDKKGAVKKLMEKVESESIGVLSDEDYEIAKLNREIRNVRRDLSSLDKKAEDYDKRFDELSYKKVELGRKLNNSKDATYFYDVMTGEKVTDENKVQQYNNKKNEYISEFGKLAGDKTAEDKILSELINTWTLIHAYGNEGLTQAQKSLLEQKKQTDALITKDPVRGEIIDEQTDLMARYNALSLLYHSTKSPVEIKKDLGYHADVFLSGVTTGIFGTQGEGINSEERFLQEVKEISNELGIPLTKEEEENTKKTIGEDIAKGIGATIPMVAEFALINKGLGAVGLLQKIEKLKSSGQVGKMALGYLSHLAKEEAVMQTIGSPTGTGVGFAAGNIFLQNLLKVTAVSPKWVSLINNMYKASVGMTAGGVSGEAVSSLVTELTTDDTYKSIMEEAYPDVETFGRKVLTGLITNAFFGISTKRPMATKEDLVRLKEKVSGNKEAELMINEEISRIEKLEKKGQLEEKPIFKDKTLKAEVKTELTEQPKEVKVEPQTETKVTKELVTDKLVEPKVETKVTEKQVELKEAGKEIENKAIEKFYETKNPKEALYITSEGKFIDGTGKNEVDKSEWQYMKERTVDHRDVAQSVSEKSGTDALIDYMNKTNNVRMSIQDKSLNIDVVSMPNEKQLSAIIKARKTQGVESIVADISNNKGDVIKSGEFKSVEDYVRFLEKNLPKKEVEKVEVKPVETKTETKVETITTEQKEKATQIPSEVLVKANDVFKKVIDENKLTEAEAGAEAYKSIKKSDWYNKLTDEQKIEADNKMNEIVERFTNAPQEPKQRIPKAEQSPAMEATQTLKNIELINIIKDSAKRAEKATKEEYSQTIKDLKDKVIQAIKTESIPKSKAGALINQINEASRKAKDSKGRVNELKKIQKTIEIINDPYIKSETKGIFERFDNMTTEGKTKKLGEGKKIIEAKHSPEYIEVIKTIKKQAELRKELEGTDKYAEAFESKREKLIDEINETKTEFDRINKMEELSKFDLQFSEIGENINKLTDIRAEFKETGKKEYKRRAELLTEAQETISKIESLEKASIESLNKRREQVKQEAEQRKQERQDVIDAVKTPTEIAKDMALKEFGSEVNGYNKLRQNINKFEISKSKKQNLIEKIDKIEQSNKNEVDKLEAIEKVFNREMPKVLQAQEPMEKLGIKDKVKQYFSRSFYQNMRGLLQSIVRNPNMKEKVMELDKQLDNSYKRFTELDGESSRILSEMEQRIKNEKLFGTKESRKFYIEQKELGIKEHIYTNEGKIITDYRKLSYNDIVRIDILLRDNKTVSILEKTIMPESVEVIKEHVSKIVESDANLKSLSEYITKEVNPSLYKVTNEAYKKKFGIDMPSIENYIQRVAVQPSKQMAKGRVEKQSLIPRHALERGNPREIKLKGGDVFKMYKDAFDMSNKWNAYGEVNTKWNYVFRNNDVRNAIIKDISGGKEILRNMDILYKNYPGEGEGKLLKSKLLSNAVASKIVANPAVLIKQLSSFPNALTHYNKLMAERGVLSSSMSEILYLKDMFDFNNHFTKEFIKDINSGIFRHRLKKGFDPSLGDYLNTSPLIDIFKQADNKYANVGLTVLDRMRAGNEMLKKIGSLPVQVGDIGAFYLGIKPNYVALYNKYKKTMSESEASRNAMKDAIIEGQRVQQPGGAPHLMSAFQVEGLGKHIPFITSPIQMGQQLREGVRTTFSPVSTPAQRIAGMKQVAYYGYIQPMMWRSIAGLFGTTITSALMKGDPEPLKKATEEQTETMFEMSEVLWTLSDGLLQGLPIQKIIKDNIENKIKGKYWFKTSIMPLATLADETMEDLSNVTKILNDNWGNLENLDDKEKEKIQKFIVNAHGMVTGHGTPSIYRYTKAMTKEEESGIQEMPTLPTMKKMPTMKRISR